MAYQVPNQWSHADRISATALNKYSDSIVAINAASVNGGLNFAIPYSTMIDAQEYWVVHSKPFLIYASTGVLVDPTGVNDDITLSSETTYNSYSVESVPWLFYGDIYKVVGCSVCFEDERGV